MNRPVFLAGRQKEREATYMGTSHQKKEKGVGSSLGILDLWAPTFTVVELEKHVTSPNTSKDHETCVALGNAIMLL